LDHPVAKLHTTFLVAECHTDEVITWIYELQMKCK